MSIASVCRGLTTDKLLTIRDRADLVDDLDVAKTARRALEQGSQRARMKLAKMITQGKLRNA